MPLERLRRIKNCQAKSPLKIAIMFNPEELNQLAEHTVTEDTSIGRKLCLPGGHKSQNALPETVGPSAKFLATLTSILCHMEVKNSSLQIRSVVLCLRYYHNPLTTHKTVVTSLKRICPYLIISATHR